MLLIILYVENKSILYITVFKANLISFQFSRTINKLVNGQWLQNVGAKLMITTRIQEKEIKEKLKLTTSTLTLESFSDKEGKLFLERKIERVSGKNKTKKNKS